MGVGGHGMGVGDMVGVDMAGGRGHGMGVGDMVGVDIVWG